MNVQLPAYYSLTDFINIGLTNPGVYQENEDGDEAKSLIMSRFARCSKNCDFSTVFRASCDFSHFFVMLIITEVQSELSI